MIKSKADYERYIKIEEDNYKKSYPNFTKESGLTLPNALAAY